MFHAPSLLAAGIMALLIPCYAHRLFVTDEDNSSVVGYPERLTLMMVGRYSAYNVKYRVERFQTIQPKLWGSDRKVGLTFDPIAGSNKKSLEDVFVYYKLDGLSRDKRAFCRVGMFCYEYAIYFTCHSPLVACFVDEAGDYYSSKNKCSVSGTRDNGGRHEIYYDSAKPNIKQVYIFYAITDNKAYHPKITDVDDLPGCEQLLNGAARAEKIAATARAEKIAAKQPRVPRS